MYLKRLDVVGFKSFADRISLEFKQGVTAVVGPNGSGKSNIIDSVRWVLGEQSAKSLRGGKMEDVIFSGCETRKALNVAEVTLTLDNEDQRLPLAYNEISVTRRVYRSGESEFFINRQPCRLKDIIELFMDSGLGKEAFSIISQGKVEEILSSKAEERRSIFEEAAGVLKYKTRKRKAEQKLSETQDNLNRVEDILYELEGQIEPLKIQAEIAKEYLEQKEELEEIEGALLVAEIENLHQKWEELQQQFTLHQKEEQKQSTSLIGKEADVVKKRDELEALDESISQLQDVLLVVTKEIEKVAGQQQLIRERKSNSKKYYTQIQERIHEHKELKETATTSLNTEKKQLHALKQELKAFQQVLLQKEERMATFGLNVEAQLEELKADYIDLLNMRATAQNELNMLKQKTEHEDIKKSRLTKENERFVLIRQELTEKMEEISVSLVSVKKEMVDLEVERQKNATQVKTIKEMYRAKEEQLYKAYHYVQKAQTRKDALDAMQEDFSGFYQGVREILKARDNKLQGIVGAVAELITVPKEVELAIETVLGAAMQHVVVADEQAARQAIAFLKSQQYGRATFLPRTIIKSRQVPIEVLNRVKHLEGYIGVGSDLVRSDQENRIIIENLLGNVIVTTNLKQANGLAKETGYRYRIVTVDGDLVNPGGSMTGGAVKGSSSSLLSRQRELDELTEKLEEMKKKTIHVETEVGQLKDEVNNLERNDETVQQTYEETQRRHYQQDQHYQKVELELKSINDRLSLYDFEMLGQEQETKKTERRVKELVQQIEQAHKQVEEATNTIQRLEQQKNDQRYSKEELVGEMTTLKVKMASTEGFIQNKSERTSSLQGDIKKYDDVIKRAEEELSVLYSTIMNNDVSEESLQVEFDEKEQERKATIELISSRREQRLTLSGNLEQFELEKKELARQHKYLEQLLKEEEVKINRLDVDIDNRLRHLSETYFLSFEAAKAQFTLTVSIEEAQKRVKLIKRTIEELGTVNIGAIDEYERIFERFNFLSTQQKDLLEAKNTLYQVIEEMDEEMKKRFEYTFYAIKTEFKQVFMELFGGGRADLILVNPDDLLNTGIEIVAQPLGKKLQNLSLLSGGERALTAIALLFAILRVRPVPFCILDEVEAALDEANVVRYAQYLRKFSNETQFIVITHRKGTMEGCDLLYGVTMQESGVSKIVSVRLEELPNKVAN